MAIRQVQYVFYDNTKILLIQNLEIHCTGNISTLVKFIGLLILILILVLWYR